MSWDRMGSGPTCCTQEIIESAMADGDLGGVGMKKEDAFEQQIASGRLGTPEENADVALYLAFDRSEYINGESKAADGGLVNTN
jgi:NAD(P)-dependent dehydrogenase (short-subunit alcohol dehydrogenase family)